MRDALACSCWICQLGWPSTDRVMVENYAVRQADAPLDLCLVPALIALCCHPEFIHQTAPCVQSPHPFVLRSAASPRHSYCKSPSRYCVCILVRSSLVLDSLPKMEDGLIVPAGFAPSARTRYGVGKVPARSVFFVSMSRTRTAVRLYVLGSSKSIHQKGGYSRQGMPFREPPSKKDFSTLPYDALRFQSEVCDAAKTSPYASPHFPSPMLHWERN